MKIFGFIPARMKASRFPGKPLASIAGKPMLQHVHERASGFPDWHMLAVATCDQEIVEFCVNQSYPVIMTSPDHTRAIDRCAEASSGLTPALAPDDIIVVVQGDEPLLTPDMIQAVIAPIVAAGPGRHAAVDSTVLAMPIHDEEQFGNPDIVKIVTDSDDRVLYTSRAPIPYLRRGVAFSPKHGAKRIGGIFAFRKHALDWFIAQDQHFLELAESCDINRICGNGLDQTCVTVPYREYYSVDRPADIVRVERALAAATIPPDGVLDRHIFIDIDGTLTDNPTEPGKAIAERIEHIKQLVGQNQSVVIWSARGAAYARSFASEHGLLEIVTAIGKPEILVDDDPGIRAKGSMPIVSPEEFFK